MRIKKLETSGFGCLKGFYEFGPSPATLIIEKNETGKSTLVAGILAALYGFDGEGLGGPGERERFRPVASEGFDVALSVQIGEKNYRIVRDFDMDSVTIWDEDTGEDITSRFRQEDGCVLIGEGLIDLSRSGFLKTSLIRQNEIQSLGQSAQIAEKIEATIDTLSGEVTARSAIALLRKARERSRNNSNPETEIDQIRERLKGYEKEWEGVERDRYSLDEKATRLIELSERRRHLEATLECRRYGALSSQKELLEDRLAHDERTKRSLQDLRSELKSLESLASFPVDREKDLAEALRSVTLVDERIGALTNDLGEARKRRETSDSQIEQAFASVQALGEAEFTDISGVMRGLVKDLKALVEHRRAYSHERRLIIQEGYPLGDYSDLKRRVGGTTAEDRAYAEGYQGGTGIKRNQILSLKRDIRMHEQRIEKAEAALKRRGGSKKWAILGGALWILLGVAAYGVRGSPYENILPRLPVDWLVIAALLCGMGLVALLWALFGGRRSRKEGGKTVSGSRRGLDALRKRKNELERQLKADRAKIEALVTHAELRSPEELCEMLERYGRLEERMAPLWAMASRLRETQDQIASHRQRLMAYMEGAGGGGKDRSWGAMVAFYKRVEAYRGTQRERREVQGRITALEKEIEAAQVEREKARESLASIFKECQLPGEGDGGKAMDAFKEKGRQFRRFLEIKDELIPKAELDQIPEETYGNIIAALKDIEASMKDLERRYPDVATDTSQTNPLTDDTVEDAKAELGRILEEQAGLRSETIHLIKRLAQDTTRLYGELEICRRSLGKSESFERATGLAIQELEHVQSELHERWAGFLNREANAILPRLNPNCESVEVKTDLSFEIKHSGLQKTLDEADVTRWLSVGARDQIYLALRLAVSRCLAASGVHLPFILDDPLITSDDDRFVGTMDFILKELAKAHQIIVLTCHEERHRRWLDQIPLSYRKRIQLSRLCLE